jgi:phosphoglycerate dehydrogenase-like enzyme
MLRIAIFDDYQNVALQLADWSPVLERATVRVFDDHLSDGDEIVDRLRGFNVVCVMRERTPLTRDILERLSQLKLIVSTGPRNASIDVEAAAECGIEVLHTNYDSSPTVELTWALILASARNLTIETASVQSGGWQQTVGDGLRGNVLGVLGLGNIGGDVARIARAFGMRVMAWSENLTPERAAATGAKLVSKRELFQQADILTIHLVLSPRTRGLVGKSELALMKRSARLVNTSRGPIVDENALLETMCERRLAGAAIDVFDVEPLPPQHPFRRLDNVIATPHIGYVSRELYRVFYRDTVANIADWLGRRS